uniref:zinc finger CCCH domain-containing protein n=1 Tax=uncultured Marinobacter sp. TaxID=187379 RepID=UPI0025913F09
GTGPRRDAGNFWEWGRGLYLQTIAASDRCSEATGTWIHECDITGTVPGSFSVVDPKWASFDARLATAIKQVAKGSLEDRIQTAIDRALLEGKMNSGRTMLCMLFRHFQPNGRSFNTDALLDVYNLTCKGNSLEAVERYLHMLDMLLLRCVGEKPSDDTMCSRFHKQVEHVPDLKRDMEDYSRMDDNDPLRTYEWLRGRCDKAIEIHRAKINRRDYEKGLQGGKGFGAAGAVLSKAELAKKKGETCRMFRDNGKCKFGATCYYAHAAAGRPPKGPKPPAPPTTTVAPVPWVAPPVIDPALAAKGKGKGKGKKSLRKAAVAAAADSVAANAALAAADAFRTVSCLHLLVSRMSVLTAAWNCNVLMDAQLGCRQRQKIGHARAEEQGRARRGRFWAPTSSQRVQHLSQWQRHGFNIA